MSLLELIRPGQQFMAGNRRLFLFCLFLFLVSGLFSFWFFFPAQMVQRYLVQELIQQTGLKMEGSEAEMLFPLGLEMDLSVDSGRSELTPLNFEDLQLTPGWTRLLSGTTAVDLQAGFSGGLVEAEAEAERSGYLLLELENVELLGLQQPHLPYRFQGQVDGTVTLADTAAGLNGQGDFSLRLRECYLLGLERLGLPERLSLGFIQLEGKFNQRRLSLEKVLLTEGTIEMSGGGTLLVADTPEQTRINLNIRLHPTQSSPESLRDLLNLSGVKPTTDGSYLLRIAGTLERPVLR